MSLTPAQPSQEELDKLGELLQKQLLGMENPMKNMLSGMENLKNITSNTFTGISKDKAVSLILKGDFNLADLQFGSPALEGGLKPFKNRIAEALQDAIEQIQGSVRTQFTGWDEEIQKLMAAELEKAGEGTE